MSRTLRNLAVAIAWVGGWGVSQRAGADDQATPRIDRVLAVEEADSYFGKYRIVFSITSPMPAPRGAVGTPTFFLGNRRVVLPNDPRDSTLLFGYVNELPDANVMFKVLSATPVAGMTTRPPVHEIAVEPRNLLAASRVARGAYEAPHIQRSNGGLDLWTAWTSADVVFMGEFARRDVDPIAKDVYRLTFRAGDALRGGPAPASGSLVVFRSSSPNHELELGGKYLVFAKAESTGRALSSELPGLVRVWWPQNDYVVSYLTTRAALKPGDKSNLRDFLVAELTGNPAVEARLSAANGLVSLGAERVSLNDAQLQTIQTRSAGEPNAAVKSAMDRLIAAKRR